MHVHEHSHARPTDFGKAFKIGIGLNLIFVVVEFVAGLVFNSISLLADAGHNLSDVLGLVLAFVAFRLAATKPSIHFTYGLGSSTIMASTINGAVLLVAVGAISWEAIGRFSNPSEVQGFGVIIVASIGVVINTLTAALFFKGQSHDLNVKGAYLHMMADAIVSVGVVVAGVVILLTGWFWVDPVVSLVIAAVIFFSTWRLFRDSLALLSHGVPGNVDLGKVRSLLKELPDVVDVHDLHVWALSTTKTALTAHLVCSDSVDTEAVLAKVSEAVNEQFGIDHTTVQLELDSSNRTCPLNSLDSV